MVAAVSLFYNKIFTDAANHNVARKGRELEEDVFAPVNIQMHLVSPSNHHPV